MSPRAKTMRDGRLNEANMAATCSVCHAVVSNRTDLPRHMRIHSNDKHKLMHRCPYPGCNFENLQKSNVATHIRTHTKSKTNNCPECDFTTADPGSLTRHRKRIHGYIPQIRRSRHPKPRANVTVSSEFQIQTGFDVESSGATAQDSLFSAEGRSGSSIDHFRPSPSISATPEYEYPTPNPTHGPLPSHSRFIASFDSESSSAEPGALMRASQAHSEDTFAEQRRLPRIPELDRPRNGNNNRSLSPPIVWPHLRDPFGPLDA
ncbi:hypothetical protein BT96DRAFT_1024956 [Gymnopus androsaceus JB14]|uniref:C2H2-type domain-containing protein n=1 Tax=Gymnopus androsaceus JB14 TaxID=1447944 RepID=A0A6A4GX37_9AGAR|nr:hypothetical protein BT96DRAFT_1024956 [Gymnopus androsaceus JB14]